MKWKWVKKSQERKRISKAAVKLENFGWWYPEIQDHEMFCCMKGIKEWNKKNSGIRMSRIGVKFLDKMMEAVILNQAMKRWFPTKDRLKSEVVLVNNTKKLHWVEYSEKKMEAVILNQAKNRRFNQS